MGAGDREAFVTLFRTYQTQVYRFARQMSGRPDVAEDVTQDVFIALMQNAFRFDPGIGALSTYLYGVTRNLVRRQLQRGRSRVEVDVASFGANPPPALVSEVDPVSELARAERLDVLRRAILSLPIHYREVVVLCELHDLSYEEAARIVDCPVGTIRSRLSRARRVLTQKCRDRGGPAEVGTARTRSTKCLV